MSIFSANTTDAPQTRAKTVTSDRLFRVLTHFALFTSVLLVCLSASADESIAYPAAFVQVNAATSQTAQSRVTVTYRQAQAVGDADILAIGWGNATSNITL